MRRNAAHDCCVETARLTVIFNQVVFVQNHGSRVHQVPATLQQHGIIIPAGYAIEVWVLHHAYMQVGIAQPLRRLLHSLHRADDHLSIEHIRQLLNKLTFNGQLLVHQRQIIL